MSKSAPLGGLTWNDPSYLKQYISAIYFHLRVIGCQLTLCMRPMLTKMHTKMVHLFIVQKINVLLLLSIKLHDENAFIPSYKQRRSIMTQDKLS